MLLRWCIQTAADGSIVSMVKQSVYIGAMHIIPSTSTSHSRDLVPGCEQHLVEGGNPG